jgi:hypothetical protein
MLTPFDHAVITLAHERGISSSEIYKRVNKILPNYRDQYTETQLLDALEQVKKEME